MGKIESIQALGAFAAISVVLTHMSFIEPGAYGVDIFFVISGCLMMHSTENGLEDLKKINKIKEQCYDRRKQGINQRDYSRL